MKKFTKLMAALALLVFMAPSVVAWGQTRAEVVAYTLDGTMTGSGSNYGTGNSITQNEISWIVTGNTQMSPWRIGGKSISNVDRPVYSTDAISDNITKIEVTHGTASGITVNSWTVIVASDASFTNVVSTLTPTFTASATTTINRPNGADWTGCYYKFVYNVTVTQTSNKFLQFVSAVFYKQEGSGPVIATPTFSPVAGTYTETQSVTISCETENSTIYYTTDGSTPDNTSTQYNGAITVSETTTINAIAYVGNDASSVATATYTIVNLEHAGTEADPYSVADARAAIDANVGVTGVYATGIVSEIVTAYNSNYGNITFDIVDELGNTATLRAYRCGGTEAANVAVNDVVVVSGNLTKYNSTYEFAEGCQLVSLTHPVVTTPVVTVTPATINAPAEGAEGTLTVTYENITEVAAEVWFCNADGTEAATYDWVTAEVNSDNNVDYLVDANEGDVRTAYFKVWAYDDEFNEVYSNLVTVNQAEYVAPTFAELPFAFDGGKSDIEETDGLYQEGLGSDYNSSPKLKFDNTGDWLLLQFNERPGTLTFNIKGNNFSSGSTSTFKVQISTDGTIYTDLATYTELGSTETKTFNNLDANVRFIRWIYTEKGTTNGGNVALGNIALAEYVAPQPSITVYPDEVSVDAEEHDGTLDLTYQYLEIESFEDFDIQFYDAEGNELNEDNEPDWIEVTTAEDEDVLLVSYFILENDGEARSAYFKVYAMDAETNLVYSNLVTVNQDEYVIPVEPTRYTLATTIESGRTYIITNGTDKAMGAQANNNRPAFDVSIEYNDEIENYVAYVNSTDVYEFAINGPDENGDYIIFDVKYTKDNKKGGYLYAAGSGSGKNYLRTQSPNDDNGKWTITIDEDGAATIVAQGTNTNKYMRFNADSNLFSCYGEGSSIEDLPYLYVKENDDVRTYVTDITADKWYLISSPVGYVGRPQYVPNMTTDAYALYSFDQSEQKEWRNYKASNFEIEAGKGYLYASDNGCTLIFSAEPSGTGQYGGGEDLWLTYDENASFKGYNLIGNIYGEKVVVNNSEEPYATRQLYIMNPNSNEIIASDDNILQPMQGAFVIAEGAGEHVYFARFGNDDEVKKGDKFVLNLSQNRGNVIDRAIVRMGEGDQLPKFMLNEDNTKLYISQNGKDYAVVRSEGQGELPVNFRAAENGTYTLSIDTEDMDMNYLHLIDNMTGMDVDLLRAPSYTFEANENDYESRFRLVFASASTDSATNESFAFFSNGNWIINNAGEATLQVIDLTGRILSSESVNGSVSTPLNAPTGVYMLRLINGDNVKVQKIVVR